MAAGSESLPVHDDLSNHRTPPTGSQTIVELTWQTAAARLTLQTDSPAMVEAAEWSAAVSQAPPPAQQSRSMAAEQVADRVAGLLLVLEEGESSPSIAGTIEGILQPMVAEYGDAVLYDLIGGIMQAMSRRGISEQRQRSMVAMLMFSLADPTAPLRMASASPGGHTLSPIWCQTSGLPSGCIRSCMTGASMSAMSCPWLSSRWHRALCDFVILSSARAVGASTPVLSIDTLGVRSLPNTNTSRTCTESAWSGEVGLPAAVLCGMNFGSVSMLGSRVCLDGWGLLDPAAFDRQYCMGPCRHYTMHVLAVAVFILYVP